MCVQCPCTSNAAVKSSCVLCSLAYRAGVTPAPGQGSLTIWMDRRGMRSALSTPALNDLRMLWVAARDVTVYESGEGGCSGRAMSQGNGVNWAGGCMQVPSFAPTHPSPLLPSRPPAEAAALRADNAALVEELEATQAALRELGVEHGVAVVAAEAGALCAEAEAARARDAAGHMMSLADQIQSMFTLCEVGTGLQCSGRQESPAACWQILQ